MRGDLLDVVLLVAVLLFAFSGYRQGLVVGVLSLVGFLGGGVLGARLAPGVAASSTFEGASPALVGLGVVFLLATVGQLLASAVGAAVRRRLTSRPARQVDAVGGGVVSVVGLLLVAWLVGTAVASSPYTGLASQVRRSAVLGAVDSVVPDGTRRFFADFRGLVDEGGFPDVFGGLTPTVVAPVDPPDPALAASPGVVAARPDVLKVSGVAESCRRRVEGTGFVFAAERVMTNAHVVAGVTDPQVELEGGERLDAEVVVYDPARDLAVLVVPGLPNDPLAFAPDPAEAGDSGVVVGYPLDGPFRADAARVRQVQDAQGPDIYGAQTVVREIYALFARVQPGNSGGPLLDPEGRVLGVIFAAAADDPTTGYALTVAEVAPVAAAGATATAPVSTQGCD